MKRANNFLVFNQKFVDFKESRPAIINVNEIVAFAEIHDPKLGNVVVIHTTTNDHYVIDGIPTDIWIELVEILKGT